MIKVRREESLEENLGNPNIYLKAGTESGAGKVVEIPERTKRS